uniref:Kindlin-2 N-terminal domain-containing protein n=1 Tax=Varanus komodoensis TaxID=61221 RepID=A0A8D2JH87_VARKO
MGSRQIHGRITGGPPDGVRLNMTSSQEYGSSTWELIVTIDHKYGGEQKQSKLQVSGNLHIGGVMLKLVEQIGEPKFISTFLYVILLKISGQKIKLIWAISLN